MTVNTAPPKLDVEAGPPDAPAKLLAHTRKEALKMLVLEHSGMRVTDAARILKVSVSTVRRDLEALVAEGCVRRVHGGAVPSREEG